MIWQTRPGAGEIVYNREEASRVGRIGFKNDNQGVEMRQVGTLPDEPRARRLVDHLVSQDIGAETRVEAGGWGIWIYREDQVDRGQVLLQEFLDDPENPRFQDSARIARAKRREEERLEREHRRKTVDLRGRLNTVNPRRCPVTHVLIAVSVLMAVYTEFGGRMDRAQVFLFSPARTMQEIVQEMVERARENPGADTEVGDMPVSSGLKPIAEGQVWRLWTPMFIHFGVSHLVFNMLALYWFGGMIELRKNSWVLGLLVLFSAPISFACEYFWDLHEYGPNAFLAVGGMSGVIYTLFGYVWMKSHYEPESYLRISNQSVGIMLIWLVACMTGALGNIANAAHVSGLAFGMVVALAPHLRDSLRWG